MKNIKNNFLLFAPCKLMQSIIKKFWRNFTIFPTDLPVDLINLLHTLKIEKGIVPTFFLSNPSNKSLRDKLKLFNQYRNGGIYQWFNTKDSKYYVGSSIFLIRRLTNYTSIIDSKGYNSRIYNSIQSHGIQNFTQVILEDFGTTEYCRENYKQLLDRETFFIALVKLYKDPNKSLNILDIAGSTKGYTHTEENKLKIGQANKERIVTNESRAKMIESMKGR